ncbi:MAG: hypothetical protein WDZ79_02075 [Candidatus Paceibacterota bacterium]
MTTTQTQAARTEMREKSYTGDVDRQTMSSVPTTRPLTPEEEKLRADGQERIPRNYPID